MNGLRKSVGIVALGLTMFSCTGNNRPQSATAGHSGPQPLDLAALQQRAEAFVPAAGKPGGTLILSSFSDPKSFNPITSTEVTTSEFTGYMYEGLVRVNGVTSLPEPALAESWDVSPDGMVWTFHIRKGVRWSDSVPFSAYDVAFTFNDLIFNKSINPNSARDMFMVEGRTIGVTAIDSHTVRFALPSPFAPFLRAMSQEILPRHAYQRLVTRNQFSNSLGIKTPPAEMVCNGPFLLESYISSQKVVFRRNPLYWKQDSAGTRLPYLERIIYMVVADRNAELLRFQKGEIDFLSARGEDFPALKRGEQAGTYTVYRLGPALGSSFVFFNQNTGVGVDGKPYVEPRKQALFRSREFRQAVAFAIDKQSMIRTVLNGLGYAQSGPMGAAEGFFYNPDVPQYRFNLDSARARLGRLGLRDRNGDGVLEDSAGMPVEFSFLTNSGNDVRVRLAEIVRKDLELLGFKVHFQQMEFNSLIQKMDNPPYGWDAVMLGLTGGPEPHFGRNVWHSSGSLHMWHPRQSFPSTDWERRIDSLFDAGVKELDAQQRKGIYDEWQRIAATELPLIYTVLAERIYCISRRFKNINPAIFGGMLHNLDQVYVEE